MRAYPSTSVGATRYNVKDSGAAGDLTTDDTAAIQTVINGCQNNGGGEVVFPSGVAGYQVGSLLVSNHNVTLKGEGMGSRIACNNANASTILVRANAGATAPVNHTHINNLRFNPLVQKANNAFEIDVPASYSLVIRDLYGGTPQPYLDNPAEPSKMGSFISLGSVTPAPNTSVNNTFITNIRGFDMHQVLKAAWAVDINLYNVMVNMNRLDSVALYFSTFIEAISGVNVHITNSKGVLSDLSAFTAIDLHLDGKVRFSKFTNCFWDTANIGVLVEGDCYNITFLNNWFSARPGAGAVVRAKNSLNPEDIRFTDPEMVHCGREGIRLEAGSGHSISNPRTYHNGFSAAGLADIFIGALVSGAMVTGGVGSNTKYNARLPNGQTTKGIHVESGATNILLDGNNFSAYPTAILAPTNSASVQITNTNQGTITNSAT